MTAAKANVVPSALSDQHKNHLKLASDIVQAMNEQRLNGDFTDCTVVVDSKEFSSHRFVLSACSGFFRACFVSGMIEDRDRRVNISGISHKIFILILDCIFKAEDIVTTNNMIDIWHASNQLDISFLLKHCEDFIAHNITFENCLNIYNNGKLVDSKRIVNLAWDTILKGFNTLRCSTEILNLSLEEMKSLLESHYLNVTSEDHVIELIIRWISHEVTHETNLDMQLILVEQEDVSHQIGEQTLCNRKSLSRQNSVSEEGENSDCCLSDEDIGLKAITERTAVLEDPKSNTVIPTENNESIVTCDIISPQEKEERSLIRLSHVADLLSASRYCLLSERAITHLLSNNIILADGKAMSFIKESICYQMISTHHESLTPSTIHRASSKFQNVIGWLGTKGNVNKANKSGLFLNCMSIINQKIMQTELSDITKVVVDEEEEEFTTEICPVDSTVYSDCIYMVTCDMCYQFDYHCKTFMSTTSFVSRTGHAVTSVGEYIYILGGTSVEVRRMNARNKDGWKIVGSIPISTTNSTLAVVGANIIILGGSVERNDTTAVQCFNTETLTSYQMNDIAGPPHRIMTFKKSDQTFVLFRTGALWKLETSEIGVVSTRYVTLLWDFDRNLNGAVLCRDQLYLFDNTFKDEKNTVWSISVPGVLESVRNVCAEGITFHSLVIPKSSELV